MTDIGKFLSDVEKIMKYDRQNNGGKTDYKRTAKDIRKLFERSTNCPGELPGSVFEYWENQYVLNSADLIAAEDTRHTLKLLNHFGIKKPMVSYFEHNKRERGEAIVAKLKEGQS